MLPTTPTLPTVIVTPCTPLYLLPTRSAYRSSTPSSSSLSSSSTRQYTRKQHLVSALQLGPSLFSSAEGLSEKPDNALLLPSPIGIPTRRDHRRTSGVLLSLLLLGMFGLVLVGPMLPYKWYTGATGAEAPALMVDSGEMGVTDVGSGEASQVMKRRGLAYGPGEGSIPAYADTFGPGQAVHKRGHGEGGRKARWRRRVTHGLEEALLD